MGIGLSVKRSKCPSYRAYFRLTSEMRVCIFFLKRHLPDDVIQQHFAKGHFEMPYNFELPPVVLHKLGIDHYRIHSGLYSVAEDRDFIKVYF